DGIFLEQLVDHGRWDRRQRGLGDGRDGIEGALEQAGPQPENLTRQDEIHDLARAVVEDLVTRQPAVVIDVDTAVVFAGDDDVAVLAQPDRLGAAIAGEEEAPVKLIEERRRCGHALGRGTVVTVVGGRLTFRLFAMAAWLRGTARGQ